jgi:hypothetical protein
MGRRFSECFDAFRRKQSLHGRTTFQILPPIILDLCVIATQGSVYFGPLVHSRYFAKTNAA